MRVVRPKVTWVRAEGGLYVWMSIPARIETGFDSPLFKQATKVDPQPPANATKCTSASASNRRTASKKASAAWQPLFERCSNV